MAALHSRGRIVLIELIDYLFTCLMQNYPKDENLSNLNNIYSPQTISTNKFTLAYLFLLRDFKNSVYCRNIRIWARTKKKNTKKTQSACFNMALITSDFIFVFDNFSVIPINWNILQTDIKFTNYPGNVHNDETINDNANRKQERYAFVRYSYWDLFLKKIPIYVFGN